MQYGLLEEDAVERHSSQILHFLLPPYSVEHTDFASSSIYLVPKNLLLDSSFYPVSWVCRGTSVLPFCLASQNLTSMHICHLHVVDTRLAHAPLSNISNQVKLPLSFHHTGKATGLPVFQSYSAALA